MIEKDNPDIFNFENLKPDSSFKNSRERKISQEVHASKERSQPMNSSPDKGSLNSSFVTEQPEESIETSEAMIKYND